MQQPQQDDAGHAADPTYQSHDEPHVVPPSWQPLILAIGITLTLAGIAITPIMWIAGLVISITAIVNWLGQLRRDYHGPSADAF